MHQCFRHSVFTLGFCLLGTLLLQADDKTTAKKKVSFEKEIQPIFQAHCQGCHQPAKARGDYVMTSFEKLLAGGDSGKKAIVAGKPAESDLLRQITPVNGKARMPEGKPHLTQVEIDLIKQWISEGAENDSKYIGKLINEENPPVYSRLPVITSLDYSPDGKWLAVSGYHEVLLFHVTEDYKPAGRLIGLSERIQTVRFSPNSETLAVAAGQPARMGEIQIWDINKKKLLFSKSTTYDTVYGVNWSPDGTKVAYGCADNTVRAIDVKTGEQVFQQGSHNDWILDTIFTKDNANILSVGRDRTVKLSEVATQRFVDNVTSITPGALRGGINSIARHPSRDEIVVGGADGTPKVYRIFRETARVIGDDANLLRELEPMPGRVNGVAVSTDGKRIAAVNSLDGLGVISIHSYEFDTKVPDEIKKINSKTVDSRNAKEKADLIAFYHKETKLIGKLELKDAALFTISYHPKGETVAVAGSDGMVRILDAAKVTEQKKFPVVQLTKNATTAATKPANYQRPFEPVTSEAAPTSKIVQLEVEPKNISFKSPFDYAQLLVTARLESGDRIDVTRLATKELSAAIVELQPTGILLPRTEGEAKLTIRMAGQAVTVPIQITGLLKTEEVAFSQDVMPVLSRMGCNAGTCHGSQQGKNGFKLSLRGYDPIFDIRAFTDEMASRRTNVASAADSLMLLKATASVPHVGGQLFKAGEAHYEVIRQWISQGAQLKPSPKVVSIDVFPKNPVIQKENSLQQMRIIATFSDGKSRDVTLDAFIESGNSEVATANKAGLITAIRRGEAPILARYEGSYAATTVSVMGDRSAFVWKKPEGYSKIDDLVASKWKRMKILPSDVCGDAEFLRRAYLDLTGLPPTIEEVKAFLEDKKETRAKREAIVDKLIGSPDFVDYWTNKWADLLQVNRKFLGVDGAKAFREWIRKEVEANTPYDQFVRKILTVKGSNKAEPAASYYKILRDPASIMENTTHLFLGVRFNCNKCHDHPFERWTQDQYYETAAYFAQVKLDADPASGNNRIGATAVEAGKPIYEIISDQAKGEINHERTGNVAAPKFPFKAEGESKADASRRDQLASWITARNNPYFARSFVNRVWGYLFGAGLIEPLDDIRAGNPPSNPELLNYLADEFIKSNFDVRKLMTMMAKSRTYQLSVIPNQWNADDKLNFSHAYPRRLQAEVLYDTIHKVVGSTTKVPGVNPGTRAAALPDVGYEAPGGFLATTGRPVRESACECERSTGLQLGAVMTLVNGQVIGEAIGDSQNALVKLAAEEKDDKKLIETIFLRIYNRPVTPNELKETLAVFQQIKADHETLAAKLKEREDWFAKEKPGLEKKREEAIALAEGKLAEYRKEYDPRRAKEEKDRLDAIEAAKKLVTEHEKSLLSNSSELEKKLASGRLDWVRLNPRTLNATNGSSLQKRDDLSIVGSGELKKTNYTITAGTDLRKITAMRLEVLSDDKLPSKGPGRAPNGNFVLSQFEVKYATKKDPKAFKPVAFSKATADFSQDSFGPDQTINGKANNGDKGWAIVPNTGTTHWVVYELKEALDAEEGVIFSITLKHQHSLPDHSIGRFRISITSSKPPVALGVFDELQTVIDLPNEQRSDAQKAVLQSYYKSVDPKYKELAGKLAVAQRPLPMDAKLTELETLVKEAKKPVPTDGKLAQLRLDAEQSKKQTEQERLTAVQDIAWALINSPAFLFNH